MKCLAKKCCIFPNTCKYNKMCMQSEINKAEQIRINNNDKGGRKMKFKKTKAIGILAAAAFSIRLIIRNFKIKK